MNNLFAVAKEKSLNRQIKEKSLSQEIVIRNELETDHSDKEKSLSQEIVIRNRLETDHSDKDKIMIPQNQTLKQSKIKIELKKNPIIQPNSLVKNVPLNAISKDQLCQKKISRNRLHTAETNHKHHKERYGNGGTQYAIVQKKKSIITRMNQGGNVSPQILKKYEITKKDITNWEKIQIDILNSLDINEETLSQQEWFELIRLRPELNEKSLINIKFETLTH
jgi:hypothetical protein